MTLFDKFFFSVFKHYKDAQNKKANQFATIYISVLQCTLILLFGVFFAGFFNQMNVNTLSQDKAIILFVLACVFIFFKNWMQYAGRKRKVLNAKMLKSKSLGYNIWLIWLLPFVCLGLSLIIYQAV